MTYPHNGKPVKPSSFDRLFTLDVSPWVARILLGGGLLALIVALAMAGGCQKAKTIPTNIPKPASVAPAVESNSNSIFESIKSAIDTANTLEKAQKRGFTVREQAQKTDGILSSITTHALFSDFESIIDLVIEARKSNDITIKQLDNAKTQSAAVAAGIDERDRVIEAQKKIIAAQVEALKRETERADNAEKAMDDVVFLVMVGIGGLFVIGGGVTAALLVQSGSIWRAIGAGAVGLIFGLTCMAIGRHLGPVLWILAIGIALAALIGLAIGILHYRKHFKKAKAGK